MTQALFSWLQQAPEALEASAWQTLLRQCPALNDALTEPGLSRDCYRDWYEALIPKAIRLQRGQYFTPDPICDLMLGMTYRPDLQKILDPCCGTGAFLMRCQALFNAFEHLPPGEVLNRLFGVELDPQAALLSTLQLADSVASPALRRFPHIHPGSFLAPLPSDFSAFDLIIGNPPYVRQEHLHQQASFQKEGMIAQFEEAYAFYLQAFPKQRILFQKKADLYLWFFLRATQLLKPAGTLAFITSNSWLNTTVGSAFQHFLLHHFRVRSLLETTAEAWFHDAAINPLILVLEKKETAEGEDDPSNPAALIRLKAPLREILPNSQAPAYWQDLIQACQKLLQGKMPKGWGECRMVPQQQLLPRDHTLYRNWALPLRVPSGLATLFERSASKWVPLKTLGRVRYPLKTGINPFFYVTPERVAQFRIEAEFLFPVIKSTWTVQRYLLTPADTELSLFSCLLDLPTLKAQGKTGALAYIEWGSQQTSPSRQKRPVPISWPQVASVQGRKAWYQVAPLPPPHLLSCRFIDRRFFFPLCEGPLMEDQTFYGITLFEENSRWRKLVAAILNSTLSYLLVELYGRTNLGDGVLQYATTDMSHFPVLDPTLLSLSQQDQLIEAFEAMAARPLLPIEDEVLQADRQVLDRILLAAVSPATEGLCQYIAESLLERVAERRSLPRLRREQRRSAAAGTASFFYHEATVPPPVPHILTP